MFKKNRIFAGYKKKPSTVVVKDFPMVAGKGFEPLTFGLWVNGR